MSWQIGIRGEDPPVPGHVSRRQFGFRCECDLKFTVYVYIRVFDDIEGREWRLCIVVSRVVGLMSCGVYVTYTAICI